VEVIGRGLDPDEDDLSPRSTQATASSAENTARPTAAPGEALSPRAMGRRLERGGVVLVAQELVDVGRLDPRERLLLVMTPSATMSVAIFTAAAAVRLALRVWSMYSRRARW
jgi:hypothetical protein